MPRLAQFKEESPYKPDSVVNHHPSSAVITDIVMRSTR